MSGRKAVRLFAGYLLCLAMLCSMIPAAFAAANDGTASTEQHRSFLLASETGEEVVTLAEDGTATLSLGLGDFYGTWQYNSEDGKYHVFLDTRKETEEYILEQNGDDWGFTGRLWVANGTIEVQYTVSTAYVDNIPQAKPEDQEGYYEAQLPQVAPGYSYDFPMEYETTPSDKPGTLELLTYQSLSVDGGMEEEHAYVYLPYGYDQADTETKYNVLYLSHGTGGTYYSMFYEAGDWPELVPGQLKYVLDNMIANGDVEPLIVVALTWPDGQTEHFQKNNFVQHLIPAVESKYNTYAEDTTPEGLKASRDHRAFSGYSQGARCAWYCFQYNLDYVKWFAPLAGAVDAAIVTEAARNSGYGPTDYYIYASTGGPRDLAYYGMCESIVEMSKMTDAFVYTNDFATGNLHLDISYDNAHNDDYAGRYLYNSLPTFFKDYGGAKPESEVTTYTVKAGDNLSKLSVMFYGDRFQWKKIYQANRDTIGSNPNLIYVGQTFVIPD